MPIEFSCPACRQLVRTPDATAGKKGRCPQCNAIVQIPAVLAVGNVQPTRPAAKPAAPQPEPAKPAAEPPTPPPIEFTCNWCGELVRTPAAAAGKRGKCPHCQRVVKIPEIGDRESGAGGREAGVGKREADLRFAEESPLKPAVNSAPTQPELAAPKPAAYKLPPSKPGAPKQPAARAATSKPAAPPDPGLDFPPESLPPMGPLPSRDLTPLASKPWTGLTPLPSDPLDGLTPLSDLAAQPSDPLAGLTPLDGPLDGLTPLPPLNSTVQQPVGADGLAVLTPLPDANPLGLPTGSSGAGGYGAYGAGGYSAPLPKPRPVISDAGRRGLPWEREPSMDSFGETLKLVITAPHEAFGAMRRSGGIGNPLGFIVVSYVVGQMLLLVEAFLFYGGLMLLGQGVASLGQGNVRLPWEGFFISFAIAAVIYLTAAVAAATIGGFIFAGIYHMGLLMFGGANASFEATYRVIAFGTGAVYMLVPIPLVGPFFALVMYFVVLIYGLLYAHETTGGRAAGAVFVPFFLATCCMCPIALMFSWSMPMFFPLGR